MSERTDDKARRDWAQKEYDAGRIPWEDAKILGAKRKKPEGETRKNQTQDLKPGENYRKKTKKLVFGCDYIDAVAGLDGRPIPGLNTLKQTLRKHEHDYEGYYSDSSDDAKSILLGYTEGSEIHEAATEYGNIHQGTIINRFLVPNHTYEWEFISVNPKIVFRDRSLLPKHELEKPSKKEWNRMSRDERFAYLAEVKRKLFYPLDTDWAEISAHDVFPEHISDNLYAAFVDTSEQKIVNLLRMLDQPHAFLLDRWLYYKKKYRKSPPWTLISEEFNSIFHDSVGKTMRVGTIHNRINGRPPTDSRDSGEYPLLFDALNLINAPREFKLALLNGSGWLMQFMQIDTESVPPLLDWHDRGINVDVQDKIALRLKKWWWRRQVYTILRPPRKR